MSDDKARELEERGIQAAKAGNKDEARKLLQNALRLNPNSENGWLWLASVLKEKKERLLCLQKVLEINPNNEMALKAVRAFGVDPSAIVPQRGALSESLVESDDEALADADIPIPSADKIAENRQALAQLLQEYETQTTPKKRVKWVKKTKNRAGEREIVVLRAQIGAALMTFLAFAVGLSLVVINNSPQVQLVLFGASPTPRLPTSTPTNTPTSTPGFTPTPSPTKDFTREPTFTPSSTPAQALQLVAWPTGVEDRTPAATPVYLPAQLSSSGLRTAVAALERNEPEDVIPLAGTEQARLGFQFNPYPSYLQAMAYLQLGDAPNALARLNEAETRLNTTTGSNVVSRDDANRFFPLINVAFARVHIQQARAAQARGLANEVTRLAGLARTRSEDTIQRIPTFADAYITLADALILERRYADAITRLTQAQQLSDLATNVTIIIQIGEVYLAQAQRLRLEGNLAGSRAAYDLAEYYGYLATYVNPFIPRGHGLRIQAAIALGDPGRAVIYSQEFLFYLPNNAEGFRQLGNAREAEGNTDLALAVYDLALQIGDNREVLADIYLSRAQLYKNEGRFAAAFEDLSNSLELRDDIITRVERMRMAYNAGNFDVVQADAELLLGSGAVSDSEVRLYQAQVLIDRASSDDQDTYSTALGLLNQVGAGLPTELIPIADEYRARAHFVLGNLGEAVNAINRSLNSQQTGTRRYLRGLILDARNETNAALEDYFWLITWHEVFDYPFINDVRGRINAIQTARAEATATAVMATQNALDATATVVVERTATAEFIATATAQFIATATAEASTPAP